MKKFESKIRDISRNNAALIFIEERLADDNYRGDISSQHNRYTMNQIISILKLLYKHTPSTSLMKIRTTDISKRPKNTSDEAAYALFCDEAKKKCGIGTQDAMRKNIFVDLNRMGLIDRYNKNKVKADPYIQSAICFVAISNQGLKLINSDNLLDQYFIFSKAIDMLLGGFIENLITLFKNTDLKKITIHEFMFFVSAINSKQSFGINYEECISLLKDYRSLSHTQQKAVIHILSDELKPVNFSGAKTNKRDFHNWKNKAEQIFTLLNQTVYFEEKDEVIIIRTKIENSKSVPKRLDRSHSEKISYFKIHKVNKKLGFELHHVVPLSWSENAHQFKLFDDWKNMVYIDAFSHAKITQNNNRNVIMKSDGNNIHLVDYSENSVKLEYGANISYKLEVKEDMLNYNVELNNTLSY